MKRLAFLAAGLLWLALLCAGVAAGGPRGAVMGGSITIQTLSLIAALAVAMTLVVAISPLRPFVSYVMVHLAGLVAILSVAAWPRPPWDWRPPQGLGRLATGAAGPVDHATLALLATALIWELAYACAWLVLRDRRVWLAVTMVVASTTVLSPPQWPDRDKWIAGLVVAALTLVAVNAAVERLSAVSRRIQSGRFVSWWLLLLPPLCAVFVGAAWAAPAPSAAATAAVRQIDLTGELGRWLADLGLSNRPGGSSAPTGLTNFGSDLMVGGRFRPDDTVVFRATVADPSRSPYWRAAVYDTYAAGVWRNVAGRAIVEAAETTLPVAAGSASATPITQTVVLEQPSNVLFTAGMPLLVNVPSVATVADAGTMNGVLLLAPARHPLSGEYQAVSVPLVTAPAGADTALPAANRAIELRIPVLPSRMATLARRLVAGTEDRYRQAWAIERYLRDPSTFTYDTAPPQTPPGNDPTDFFLFTTHRGFCTQFATAMVVLAREAGIPARLVTGYAAGHLISRQFVVTRADAHAWPELWIAGRGWQTFEPTPGFPTPFQLTGAPPISSTPAVAGTPSVAATAAATNRPPGSPTNPPGRPTRSTAVGAVKPGPGSGGSAPWFRVSPGIPRSFVWSIVAMLMAFGIAVAIRRSRPDARAMYGRLCRTARLVRAGPRPGQTPFEWASQVGARWPGDREALLAVTTLYVRQRYGGLSPSASELNAIRTTWSRLRWRWLRRAITRRVR